jgi:arsenate reductase
MAEKQTILFLCTGNSCRSQIAEAWTRHLKGDTFEPYSAGVEVHGIDPRAVKVMAEVGLDISHHQSKHVDTLSDMDFDYVITVCDHAHEACPFFPAKTKVMHVGFDDPPQLAKSAKSEEEALGHYRRVRDEIKTFVDGMPETLLDEPGVQG